MDESSWQVLGIIFSIFLGIASLLYTAYQSRLATMQMRSGTSTTMFGYLTQLNQILLENAEIEIRLLGGSLFQAPDVSTRKAQLLIDIYLSFLEEVWYQHNTFKQYTSQDWATWERLLQNLGHSPFAQEYWNATKANFDLDFATTVDRAFGKVKKEGEPANITS